MSSSDYHLHRSTLSSARLNLQHYNFVNQFGFHLHPSIPPSVGTTPGSMIADIGAGTALWAIELANQRPASNVVAMDVNLAQCPPIEWLPPNVKTSKLDLLAEDVPHEWQGAFDIVHMRHFVVVSPDIDRISNNLLKMIKPGGYMQWSEFDLSQARIYKARDDLTTNALEKMLFQQDPATPGHLRTRQTWVQDLRKVLEKKGLETVVEERRRPSPYYRNAALEVSFMSFLEMSHRSQDPSQAEKYRELIVAAEDEVLKQGKGVSAATDWLTIVATKPVAATMSIGPEL